MLVLVTALAACGAFSNAEDPSSSADVESPVAARAEPERVEDGAAAADTQRLHAPITSLQIAADGDGWVGFGLSQKVYVIPASRADMLAFARQALDDGRPVHATVRAGHGSKQPPRAGEPVDEASIRVLYLGDVPDSQR